MTDANRLHQLISSDDIQALEEHMAAWHGISLEDYRGTDPMELAVGGATFSNDRYVMPATGAPTDETPFLTLEDNPAERARIDDDEPCSEASCRAFPTADVLFLPEQQQWYVLSEEAQALFEEKEQELDEAIEPLTRTYGSADAEERTQARAEAMQRLQNLGLLQQFMGYGIASFLDDNSKATCNRLKTLILAHQKLLNDVENGHYPDDLKRHIADDHAVRRDQERLVQAKQAQAQQRESDDSGLISFSTIQDGRRDVYLRDARDRLWGSVQKARERWVSGVENDMNFFRGELKVLEAQAKQTAREEGYLWQSDSARFVESEFIDLIQAGRDVLAEEPRFRRWLRHEHNDHESLTFEKAVARRNGTEDEQDSDDSFVVRFFRNLESTGTVRMWVRARGAISPLEPLNANGWVIIEQCLDYERIVGAEDALAPEQIARWEWADIEQIRTALDDPRAGLAEASWGLEQYQALRDCARERLKERIQAWEGVLGTDAHENFLEAGLRVLRHAFEQYEALIDEARRKARRGEVIVEHMLAQCDSGKYELLSSAGDLEQQATDYAYKPESEDQITLRECLRLSTGKRLRYVTSDVIDLLDDGNHARPLNVRPGHSAPADGPMAGRVREGIEAAMNQAGARPNDALRAQWDPQSISEASIHFYHEHVGTSPDGGIRYTRSHQAQFFRYSMGASLDSAVAEVNQREIKGPFAGAGGSLSVNLAEASTSGRMFLPHHEGSPLVVEYIAKDGDEARVRHAYFGQFRFEVDVEGRGYAGATAALSGSVGIRSGNQALAVNGTEPVRLKNASTEAGTTVEGDLFAGVEAMGCLGASLSYRPPRSYRDDDPSDLIEYIDYDELRQAELERRAPAASLDLHEDWQSLFGLEATARVSAGVGLKGSFMLTLSEGHLRLVIGGRLVAGVGSSYRVAGTLSLAASRTLVDLFLGLVHSEGFRRLSVFDESDGRYGSYQFLNHAMTLAVSTGVSLSDFLLMPYDWLEEAASRRIRIESAPEIAKIINQEMTDHPEETKHWFRSLLPETKGRLIFVLLSKQPYRTRTETEGGGFLRRASQRTIIEQDGDPFDNETDQRQALLHLLEHWSSKKTSHDRQIEESLTRVHPEGDKPFAYTTKPALEHYQNQLMPIAVREEIRAFFKRGEKAAERQADPDRQVRGQNLHEQAQRAFNAMADFFSHYEAQTEEDDARWYRLPESTSYPDSTEEQREAYDNVKAYVRDLYGNESRQIRRDDWRLA